MGIGKPIQSGKRPMTGTYHPPTRVNPPPSRLVRPINPLHPHQPIDLQQQNWGFISGFSTNPTYPKPAGNAPSGAPWFWNGYSWGVEVKK